MRTRAGNDGRPDRRGSLLVSAIPALLAAALLSAALLRSALVAHYADTDPALAARLAPNAPQSLASMAMAGVGQSAAAGQEPGPETMRQLGALAMEEPLDPLPYLVRGAIAGHRDDYPQAVRFLEKARQRDPRALAVRYLLADTHFRNSDPLAGLEEIAAITRLAPASSLQVVPAIADYAQSPGARPTLTKLIREHPQLKAPLLTALSADAANGPLILALYQSGPNRGDEQDTAWQARLVGQLVGNGDFGTAYAYWRKFAGIGGNERPLIFNGDFKRMDAPAPFNWTLSSSGAGTAEAQNGRLRVLFYGRETAVLASQLLLLPPGTYRLRVPVDGKIAPKVLQWTISCASEGEKTLLAMDLAGAARPVQFDVPEACQAQKLQLVGQIQDMQSDTDILTGPVTIEKVTQ